MCAQYALLADETIGVIGAESNNRSRAVTPNTENLLIFKGYAHPQAPVITSDGVEEKAWGLIPSWVNSAEKAKEIRAQTINARAETLFTKPSFRHAAIASRCIVPARCFVEWRHEGKLKITHRLSNEDVALLYLAGVSEEWVDEATGESVKSFAIVTTAANKLMQYVHNAKQRMPAILAPNQAPEWLTVNAKRSDLEALLQPLKDGVLVAERLKAQGHEFGEPLNRFSVPPEDEVNADLFG